MYNLCKAWKAIKNYDTLLNRIDTLSAEYKKLANRLDEEERSNTVLWVDVNKLKKDTLECLNKTSTFSEEIINKWNELTSTINKINNKINKMKCKKSSEEIKEFVHKFIDVSSIDDKEELHNLINDFFKSK